FRQGRYEERRVESPEVLRGRELRPVHPLPRRHGEGRQAPVGAALGRESPPGPRPGHERLLDLRPRPGGDEPGALGDAVFPGGSRMSTIKFILDGREVEAAPDETIWQVANRLGTEIPHLCYSPKPGYRADGNCRACMVEIEGERVLAASCIRKPAPGMKVQTASERAKTSRRLVFELLVADQPPRERAHDPDSRFWHWADRV